MRRRKVMNTKRLVNMIGSKRLLAALMLASVLLVVLLSVPRVTRAHGGDTTLIHSCVNAANGDIRIIGANDTCRANQNPLDWPSVTSGYQIVTHQVFIPAGRAQNVNVACPAPKKVLGGGYDIETPDFVKVYSSEPSDGSGNVSDHQWNV